MSTKKKMHRKCENAQLPTNISDIQDSGKNLRNRCVLTRLPAMKQSELPTLLPRCWKPAQG